MLSAIFVKEVSSNFAVPLTCSVVSMTIVSFVLIVFHAQFMKHWYTCYGCEDTLLSIVRCRLVREPGEVAREGQVVRRT
jgi:hypothetical protein